MFCLLFNDCLRSGPAKMRALQVTGLLALCVFLVCFSSVSTQSFQCARYCKEASRAGYQPNKSYIYEYSGRVRTFINTLGNAEEIDDAQRGNADETGLLINCTLQIQAVSQCDYVLHISHASITDYHVQNTIRTENYDKFRQLEDALIYLPTYFAYNGKIDTICHDKSESKQVLDIKRAILSVFQNSNADFKPEMLVYESDITGNCETHYRVQDTPSGKLVKKLKNLSACDHRMSHYLSWQTVPYQTSNINAKSLPLLRSTLKCDMKYDQVLKTSKCLETHVFQPFSNGDNSALTHVTQSLILIQTSDQHTPINNAIISDVQRSSLWYVNDQETKQTENIQMALENLRKLELLTADGVDGNVPAIFGQLVNEFQMLSYQRLIEIYERIHTNSKQKSFFIDAISLLQTTSGIEVMQELYENEKINEAQMNSWLTSLNFMSEPTRKTLQVVIPLTYHKEIERNAILAFSSMLYKYCSKQNCLEDMVVLEMVKILEKPLNANACVPTSEEHKSSILLALKAVGNAGITTSFYNLQSCYLNDELAIELRLAAIAAHRRMRCAENENLDDFRDLFADSRTNSEVRIAAYLASMQCASYALFTQVKDVLYLEEANQVGSFIWTHITNLQETSVPWKSGLRKLVENEFLKNKYNTDIRKYSRNYEASKFFDSMGVGAGVEANVIFSTESFLPRSAMLNFTLDLFGESINVLEIGGRAEGFEQIVEKLVGYEQEYQQDNEHHDGQAKQQLIDQFGEKFQMLPKQPKASLYSRIFGNEINYKEFNNLKIEDIQESSSGSSSSIIYNVLKSIIKQQNIEYTKSIKFIDANYKIPTILGFPLQLKANGTATMGLTAFGELSLQDLWQYKMLVKGKIYPSVAVQVACTMSIDTYQGESGLQYISKLNSNTYIDGYANIHLGKIVDVKINVPKKQMDIFSVSSNIYIVHPSGSYAMQDVSSTIDSAEFCTDDYITRKTGLQFCNQWRYVNASILPTSPSFPLTGMFKYSTHLKKMDTFEYYHLFVETKLGESTKPEEYLVNLVIDTPNSKIDRKLEAYLMMNTKNYALESRVHSPFVKFALKSNIEQEEKKFKFHFLTHFNDKELITLHSVFDIRHVGEVTVYEPHAKVNYMKQQIAALSGTLNHIQGGDYVADLRLEGLLQDIVQINGNFSCAPHYLSVNTDIESKAFKGNFEGMLSVKTNEMAAKSRLKYHHKNNKDETAHFNAIFDRGIRKHNVELSLETSQWSRYNTKFHWENEYGHRYFNNSADLLFFETQWTTQQIVKLNDLQNNMVILGELTCPKKSINYKTELSYLITKKLIKARILAQLNLIQRVETFLRLISRELSDEVHFIVYYPTETWTLDGTRNKTSQDSYLFSMIAKHSAKFKAKPAVLVTIDGNYKNSSIGEFKNHRINVTLDLPDYNGWHTPWLISGTLQHSETMFLGSCKVNSKEDDFSAHLNWIGDSLALSMQVNDKPIFVVNGLRSEEVINAVLALNIYQHYELRVNLVRPYQKFALELFWDKERDPSRRLHFGIESNTYKGQYHMDVEYPNQKIGANVVLLPSQVVMNVTWGVKVSQRIYLKVGSKYYDVGGLYFGQLETPFKYLEKQQFNLKYYVVSDSFDVQSDISWREHNINLLISGSKSLTHLMGNLQLNTTLEEIRKVGAAISHTSDDMFFKSDAAFDYNDHSIRAAANCHIDDIVNGNFIIESPTGTIVPILGKLQMNNDDGKNMLFTLNWQDKNITTSYSFKSDRSKIEMHTPFEGIEHSLLQYSVINDAETVYLDATVALFKHNNSLTLSWSEASEEFTTFWVDVTSPVTGHYYMFATHSQQQGVLNENVRIEGPDQRDILRMYVRGDVIPSLIINVTAGLTLLDHDASVQLSHLHSPFQRTNFIAVWNERTVNSRMWFNFVDAQLQYFQWQIESNLFAPIHLYYHDTLKVMNVELQLPSDYHMRLYAHYNGSFELFMHAPSLSLDFKNKFLQTAWKQTIDAHNGDQKVRYTFDTYWTQEHNFKEITTNITYNFFEGCVVTHSYNISGYIKQDPKVERIVLEVDSTSNLQGRFDAERKIGQQLFDNSLEVNCEFKDFCDFVIFGNNEYTLWNDKSSEKFIRLHYLVKPTNQLDMQLTSNYTRFPNATFLMNFDNVNALLTVANHKFVVKSEHPYDIKLIHTRSNQELRSAFLQFQGVGFGTLGFSSIEGYSANMKYESTNSLFRLDVSGAWPGNNISFTSKFTSVRILVGQVQLEFNEALYTSTFACEPLRSLDVQITTPEDTIKGNFQMQNSIINQTFELQLSTTNSSNAISCKKVLENVKCSAVADYLNIPHQELAFDWNSLSGNGTYTDGNKDKHRFTLSTPGFTQWAFSYYLPNGTLMFNINANGRFESSKDFEFTMDGTWKGQKVKLDLKNYFGNYYQTTFNLVTPLKGWTRIGLDCTLNDRKIGLQFIARNKHMSLIARRNLSELLTIEYQGETLLEVSSREGFMTLRTTNYFGNYRLFIQSTQTPGIYVFSILKNGENLVSFMLQNYSTNAVVLHFKGKLMAPEILPNNATLNIEFKVHTDVWQLLDFKLKKNNKPFLQIGWENTVRRNGFEGLYVFQSSVPFLPNFMVNPSINADGAGVVANVKYPCERIGKCFFDLVINDKGLVVVSRAPIDALSFDCESAFKTTGDLIESLFELNNAKQENIFKYKLRVETNKILDFWANVQGKEVILKADMSTKKAHIELVTVAYAKLHYHNKQLLLDAFLPEKTSIKGSFALSKGSIAINGPDKYTGHWAVSQTLNKTSIIAGMKVNDQPMGNITYHYHFDQEYNGKLHISYNESRIDAVVSGIYIPFYKYSTGDIRGRFSLFSNIEQLTNVSMGTAFKHTNESMNIEQYFRLDQDEFVLNASIVLNEFNEQVLSVYCKPFKNSVIRDVITVKGESAESEHGQNSFKFDLTIDDKKYVIKSVPYINGYEIFATNENSDDKILQAITITSDSLYVKAEQLGILKDVLVRINKYELFVFLHINESKQVFFLHNGAFGVIASKDAMIIGKVGGMPFDVEYDSDLLKDKREILLVGVYDNSRIKFALDYNKFFNGTLIVNQFKADAFEFEDSYTLIYDNYGGKPQQLMVYKDFNRIVNYIYYPVEVSIDTNAFVLRSPDAQLKLSNTNLYLQHPLILLDISKQEAKIVTEQQRLEVILTGNRFMLRLNNILLLEYEIDYEFKSNLRYVHGNHNMTCQLRARDLGNIAFRAMKNDDLVIMLKNWHNTSSIAVQLQIPQWEILELFDIALDWNITKDFKLFTNKLNVKSSYTGDISTQTKFHFEYELLDIRACFKAPVLKGFEYFNSTIYIPKEFRPFIEIETPNDLYKLYFDYSEKHIDTGIIYNKEKFLLNYMKTQNYFLNITIPDERLKHVFLNYDHRYQLLTLKVDQFWLKVSGDFPHIEVGTPYVGYERFGFLFKCLSNEFKFVVFHPAYSNPLGIVYKHNLNETMLKWFYSMHSPFTIHGYNFAMANFTANITAPNKFTLDLQTLTNLINNTVQIAYRMDKEKKVASLRHNYNGQSKVFHLGFDPTNVLLAVGSCMSCEAGLTRWLSGKENETRYLSDDLHIIQVSLREKIFRLAIHDQMAPIVVERRGNEYFKLIWDFRTPQQSLIGVVLHGNHTLDIHIADNLIKLQRIKPTPHNYTLSAQFNKKSIEYRYIKENRDTTQTLSTPFGEMVLMQAPRHTRWYYKGAKESLSISNELIGNGTFISRVQSSFLKHDVILNVTFSNTIIDSVLIYSDQPEKQLSFKMSYAKSNANEQNLTSRLFVLRHPASMIDYELSFSTMRSPEMSNGSVTLKYRDYEANNALREIHGFLRVDHPISKRFGVHVEVGTHRNRFNMMATSTSSVEHQGFLMNVAINDKDPLNIECTYSFKPESPSVSLMAAYGNSRKYVLYAGLPNEKEVMLKLGHEIYGKASIDALAVAKLNTTQLLWMKMMWKNNLYAPFHEAVLEEYKDLRFVVEAIGRELIDSVHDDVGKQLMRDVKTIKLEVVKRTIQEFSEQWLPNKTIICTNTICKYLYDNERLEKVRHFVDNQLELIYDITRKFLEATWTSIEQLCNSIVKEVDIVLNDIKNIQRIKIDCKGLLREGINTARRQLKAMEDTAVRLLDELDRYIAHVRSEIEKFFDPLLNLIDDFIAYVEQRLTIFQIAILDALDNVQKYIFDLREIKALYSMYHTYINWLEELHVVNMLEPLGDMIEQILETIIADVRLLAAHYRPYLDAMGDALFGKYDGLQQLPPIVEMREHVNRIYHKTVWMWNYHNMTETLKQCVKKLSRDVDNALSFIEFDNTNIASASDDIDSDYSLFGYNYVLQPENRLIEISQPLPVEWEAFDKSPSFEHYPLYQRILGKSEQFIRFHKSRYELIDALENVVVDLYEPNIAPATQNLAMTVDDAHYATFNGMHYGFRATNCAFLLATDFRSKSFSLIANYNANGRRTYEVLADGAAFEIINESNVTMNGQPMDLPVMHKQLVITRQERSISIESRDFKMTCYFHYEYCTVQLSGWLFGKTAGLLGTLDNERYTDAMTSSRQLGNLTEFIQSWQVDGTGQCKFQVLKENATTNEDYSNYACYLLFDDAASPLSECYHKVPPKPYRTMCNHELQNSASGKICSSVAAYVHKCRRAKVSIDMPEICVTCNGDFGYKEEIFDGHNNKTIDVVFINELDCHNNSLPLAETLDTTLIAKGFKNNRFANIGYGGKILPKPHIYTHHGQIWSKSKNMVPSTHLAGRVAHKNKFTAIDAIQYAANLEYRVGVSKLFVLAQCEVAKDLSNSPEVYNMLGEKDVTLHLLKPHAFKRKDVVGVSLTTAVPATTNDLQSVLNAIDDVYAGLALSTNGTLFDIDKLHVSNVSEWARMVTANVRRSPCQKCKCVPNSDAVGRIQCTRCLAPAVKQFLNEYEEGNKMKFNDDEDSFVDEAEAEADGGPDGNQ